MKALLAAGLIAVVLMPLAQRGAAAAPFASSGRSSDVQISRLILVVDKELADELWEPELSSGQLAAIERQGGRSGIDCSAGRQLLPTIFQYRKSGQPLDDAHAFLYNESDGPRTKAFLRETVDQIYQNPAKMAAMIKNGHWSQNCVKFIRGY